MTRKKIKREEKRDAFLDLAGANFDKIVSNEDLLIEILLRVPAKSLIKFQCVSKSWLRFLSDPRFCYNHSYRAPKVVTRIYFHIFGPALKSVSLQGCQNYPNLAILKDKPDLKDICNGLILTTNRHSRGQCFVSNLTIQKSTLIPELKDTFNDFLFACLAFDPTKSPYYRVIFIKHVPNPGSYQIDIYSSETKSWRCVEFSPIRGNPLRKRAYWNGAIHWLSDNYFHTEFDYYKEELIETPIRENPKILHPKEIHVFGECNGSLLLIQFESLTALKFRILEMKHDTRFWVVKKRVNLRPILGTPILYPNIKADFEFQVLSVVKGSRENDLVLVLASGSVFFSYDLRTKAVKELGRFERKASSYNVNKSWNSFIRAWGTHKFFESLFPI